MLRKSFGRVVKALSFGSEQKSLSLSDPAILEIFPSPQAASGVTVSAGTALRVPAVLHAVRLISETIGSLPCKLHREVSGSKETAKDHGSYRLVHRFANEWTSAGQLRVDLTADAVLHGAGYAQVVRFEDGRPFELHRLAPGKVQRRFKGNSGEPYYLVQPDTGRQVELSFRDVLYVPSFLGTSPVTLGKDAIGVAMTLERHAAQFFANKATMKPILKVKPGSDDTSSANRLKNIAKSFRNASNDPGLPVFISTEVEDITNFTMTSTDAQFLENRTFQLDEIARAIGVPPTMLYELDRGTWSNTEQMATSFLQLCLRPWLDRWQDAYAIVLLPEDEQDDHYFEFVTADLERADAAGRAEIYSKAIASRWMTPNEVRARENMPRHDDPSADELANPYTTTTTTTGPATVPAKENA